MTKTYYILLENCYDYDNEWWDIMVDLLFETEQEAIDYCNNMSSEPNYFDNNYRRTRKLQVYIPEQKELTND